MPSNLSRRDAVLCALLVVASISMTACESSTAKGDAAAGDRTSFEGTTQETATVSVARCLRGKPSDAQVEDSQRWAREFNVPLEKAIRGDRLNDCYLSHVMDLRDELEKKETETFAGSWTEYEPEFHYVFLFTHDGEETIRPYIEGKPYARFIETRSWADANLKELDDASDKARRLFDSRLKYSPASDTNIKKNRIEIYVKDKAQFETRLREASVRLPDHVVIVESGACCVRLD